MQYCNFPQYQHDSQTPSYVPFRKQLDKCSHLRVFQKLSDTIFEDKKLNFKDFVPPFPPSREDSISISFEPKS